MQFDLKIARVRALAPYGRLHAFDRLPSTDVGSPCQSLELASAGIRRLRGAVVWVGNLEESPRISTTK